jgi:hypothetical protein
MSRLRTAAAWGALLVGPLLLAGVVGAAPDDKAAEHKEGKVDVNLELAYAEAQFKLAEVSLKKLELTNQRFPRTISSSVIADYAEDLAIAKAQLDSARQGADADLFLGWVRRVESNMKTPALAQLISVSQERSIHWTYNDWSCASKSRSCSSIAASCWPTLPSTRSSNGKCKFSTTKWPDSKSRRRELPRKRASTRGATKSTLIHER